MGVWKYEFVCNYTKYIHIIIYSILLWLCGFSEFNNSSGIVMKPQLATNFAKEVKV